MVGTARIDSIQPLGTLTFDGSLKNAMLGALLAGFVGAGLVFGGATGWCGMAKLLQVMPWNRTPAGA